MGRESNKQTKQYHTTTIQFNVNLYILSKTVGQRLWSVIAWPAPTDQIVIVELSGG